jgi:hypothetical protein
VKALAGLAFLVAGCDLVSGLHDFSLAGVAGAPQLPAGGEGGMAGQDAPGGAGAPAEGGGGAGGQGGVAGMGGAGGEPLFACSFADDFAAVTLDPMWTEFASSGVVVSVLDELSIGMPPGDGPLLGSVRTPRFDATDCQVTVRYQGIVPGGALAHFDLLIDEDNRAGFLLYGNELRFHHEIGAVKDDQSAMFDAAVHAYWRIVHEGGSFVWLTSTDGELWVLQRELASRLPTRSMRVVLGAEVLPATDGQAGYQSRFDDVAAGPPGT